MSDVTRNERERYERLIKGLAADLTPVKRLRSPMLRALFWLGVVGFIAVILAFFSDLGALEQRLMAAPDLWLAVTGSALTAVLAAIAAFELSLPDRKPVWALLPLGATLLWIGASTMGCLRTWLALGTHEASFDEAKDCLLFIVGLSIPLSVLLILMLRRAHSLRPNLTAAVGGLAAASAAATLLNFFHPYDAAATDLIVHTIAVAIVIAANEVAGRKLLCQ